MFITFQSQIVIVLQHSCMYLEAAKEWLSIPGLYLCFVPDKFREETAAWCPLDRLLLASGAPYIIPSRALKTHQETWSGQRAPELLAHPGHVHHAALANERYSDFLLHCMNDDVEAFYRIQEAIRFYKDWGASSKVQHLSKFQSTDFVAQL